MAEPPAAPVPAPQRRSPWAGRTATPAVGLLWAVAAFGAVLCVVFLLVGGRAHSGPTRYPMRNVIGLPVAQAKHLLLARGPVSITVVKVPYGANGIVLRATGFDIDGTYGPESHLRLQVGGHVPRFGG